MPSPIQNIGQLAIAGARRWRAAVRLLSRRPRAAAVVRGAAGPPRVFPDAHGVRLMLSGAESGECRRAVIGATPHFRVDDIHGARTRHSWRAASRSSAGPHMIARMPDHELWDGVPARSRRQRPRADGRGSD